jgi:hypothetical protein
MYVLYISKDPAKGEGEGVGESVDGVKRSILHTLGRYTYSNMTTLPPHEYEFRFQQPQDAHSLCWSRYCLPCLRARPSTRIDR